MPFLREAITNSIENKKIVVQKNMVFKMIDDFLSKAKFKDFFNKNVAAL